MQAAGAPIEWEIIDLCADETGNVHIDDAVASLRRNKVGLKGNNARRRCGLCELALLVLGRLTDADLVRFSWEE